MNTPPPSLADDEHHPPSLADDDEHHPLSLQITLAPPNSTLLLCGINESMVTTHRPTAVTICPEKNIQPPPHLAVIYLLG